MKILQSRSFERKVKRFTKKEKEELDRQIQKIMDNPYIGSEKKGDLRGVYIHKFKIRTIQNLMVYRFIGEDLELIIIGPHKNYYRDLNTPGVGNTRHR
ncbi:MAG: type II toxin-antitoxin system RelE/ParE family toxin [Deltaproteobacteria bacterium]|nr:type II toxin-antitoxin system RelE/ParE family toxin [Deltaproteobacteria bacterium]